MDRATALRRVEKLLALADPARGGTDGERAVAQAKANLLIERFGLLEWERRTAAPPLRRSAGFRAPRSGPAVAWSFDPRTGEAGGGVKVHQWRDRANWKIEIPYEAIGRRRDVDRGRLK